MWSIVMTLNDYYYKIDYPQHSWNHSQLLEPYMVCTWIHYPAIVCMVCLFVCDAQCHSVKGCLLDNYLIWKGCLQALVDMMTNQEILVFIAICERLWLTCKFCDRSWDKELIYTQVDCKMFIITCIYLHIHNLIPECLFHYFKNLTCLF